MVDIVNKIYMDNLNQFIYETVGTYKSKNVKDNLLKISWKRYEGFVMDFIPGDRYEDISVEAIQRILERGKWRKTH